METIRLSVTLAKTGTTAHTQYFPTPSASSGPGSKWKFLGAQIQPQATLAANGTDYRTVDVQVGGSSVVTSLTSAATAFTAGTTRAFTVTGVGSAIEVTRAAPLSAVLAHAGSGGTFEGTVTAEFEVLP
jgi:hypothetical protein